MDCPGYIYILIEATVEEAKHLRSNDVTPTHYKVGKALWKKEKPSRSSEFARVEDRQGRLQSCNSQPITCIRLFRFQNAKVTSNVESEFHKVHGPRHGLRLYRGHEWYRSSLSISDAAAWLVGAGGEDVTARYPNRLIPGAYEEGAREVDPPLPFIVYVMAVDDGGPWYRIMATAYDLPAHRWYNTGNPREVTLLRKLVPRERESIDERNQKIRRFMSDLTNRYGISQSPVARKPDASWNTLAWVQDPSLHETFDQLAVDLGLR